MWSNSKTGTTLSAIEMKPCVDNGPTEMPDNNRRHKERGNGRDDYYQYNQIELVIVDQEHRQQN